MAQLVITYLCLGGNLGDRLAALTEALSMLDRQDGLRLETCSSVYETEPWAVADQPNFLNLVAAFETTLSPVDLLTACKDVEARIGRAESYRWGPRLIDVDILLYGDQVVSIADPDLQIPHARMSQRGLRTGTAGRNRIGYPGAGATRKGVRAIGGGRRQRGRNAMERRTQALIPALASSPLV